MMRGEDVSPVRCSRSPQAKPSLYIHLNDDALHHSKKFQAAIHTCPISEPNVGSPTALFLQARYVGLGVLLAVVMLLSDDVDDGGTHRRRHLGRISVRWGG